MGSVSFSASQPTVLQPQRITPSIETGLPASPQVCGQAKFITTQWSQETFVVGGQERGPHWCGGLQSVCIAWGCHNQVPQTRCFKQQKFILSAVEAGSPKSRCQQGHTASETHSAILPCFSPLSGDSLACRHVSPISASVLMWPSSYKDASYVGLACVCAKLLQLCLTLCHPMDCSLPGSSVHGIFQARILELVAFSF